MTVPRFRLLTGEEFERLSVREMVAYQRELAARVREQIDGNLQSQAEGMSMDWSTIESRWLAKVSR